MRRPWKVGTMGEVELVDDEPPILEPGDWTGVEAELGLALPTDYKELIGDGPACVLDAELFIASPFDANRHTNLGGVSYYWDTSEADADRWTVFASGRPTTPPGEWHPWSLTAYLDRLRDGSIPASGLGDWPSRDAEIRRWAG